MNTASPRSLMFQVTTLCLSCLVTGTGVGLAQQSSYPQQPQYASTYNAPRQPSVQERIQSASQNVGNFIRRKFYGESAPVAYPQQPVYQPRNYSLDAPAQVAGGAGGTGFLRPAQGTTPTYVRPPVENAAPLTTTKPAPATKAAPPRPTTRAPLPGPTTTATKRYSPAKPSTFVKSKPAAPKRVEDAAPARSEPARYDAPPKEPLTEARLNPEVYPLPGGPAPASSNTSRETESAPTGDGSTASSSTTTGSTTAGGSKSSGSFLIGKKTSKAGRVVSPHAPYNELDITGLPSGSLALDPTTQQVFEVP